MMDGVVSANGNDDMPSAIGIEFWHDDIGKTTQMELLMMSMGGDVESSRNVPLAKGIDCRFSLTLQLAVVVSGMR